MNTKKPLHDRGVDVYTYMFRCSISYQRGRRQKAHKEPSEPSSFSSTSSRLCFCMFLWCSLISQCLCMIHTCLLASRFAGPARVDSRHVQDLLSNLGDNSMWAHTHFYIHKSRSRIFPALFNKHSFILPKKTRSEGRVCSNPNTSWIRSSNVAPWYTLSASGVQ